MNNLIKILILIIKDFSIFSSPTLRILRWWLYRKYYKAPKLFVDTRVTISMDHINPSGAILTRYAEKIGIYTGNPARKIGTRHINES
ncbi:MAG: hypothetical protein MJK12_08580 [Colwellia sp.]|nr:hypothetical protein [Colwellia sp.]